MVVLRNRLTGRGADNPVRHGEETDRIARPTAVLGDLQYAARVGTGSLRRQAQLRHMRPDLLLVALRLESCFLLYCPRSI